MNFLLFVYTTLLFIICSSGMVYKRHILVHVALFVSIMFLTYDVVSVTTMEGNENDKITVKLSGVNSILDVIKSNIDTNSNAELKTQDIEASAKDADSASAEAKAIANSLHNTAPIQCAADFGKTTACCDQKGDVGPVNQCSSDKPTCSGFVLDQKWGTCN